MKKRISALFIAILMVMFCLPISVSAEETSTKTPETVGGYEGADDLARWGIGEEYAIVPCNAGTSAVDLNGSNGTDITIHKSHINHTVRSISAGRSVRSENTTILKTNGTGRSLTYPTQTPCPVRPCRAIHITAPILSSGSLKVWATALIPFRISSTTH